MGLPAPWTLPANPPEASPSGPALGSRAEWNTSRPPATRTAASSADVCTLVLRDMNLPPLRGLVSFRVCDPLLDLGPTSREFHLERVPRTAGESGRPAANAPPQQAQHDP